MYVAVPPHVMLIASQNETHTLPVADAVDILAQIEHPMHCIKWFEERLVPGASFADAVTRDPLRRPGSSELISIAVAESLRQRTYSLFQLARNLFFFVSIAESNRQRLEVRFLLACSSHFDL